MATELACQTAQKPDPKNELPFGVIDTPQNNDTVGRVVDVSGWALDDSRVVDVKGFVDGTSQASVALTIVRPDVARRYPAYAHAGDKYGWSLQLDLGEQPGVHTILVTASDNQGATREIGVVSVNLVGR